MSAPPAERALAPFGARVASVTRREEHGAYVVLACRDPAGPPPRPGQFYMLMAAERWGGGAGERPFLPRAFSVLRAPGGVAGGPAGPRELQFLLETVGPGTQRLGELGPGAGLSLVGPLGQGFRGPRDGRHAVLVGGGVGIAPLAAWQDELGLETPVLVGFRDAAHAVGAELLTGARVSTEDGSVGRRGLISTLLEEELDADHNAEVYACGPPPMLEAVRNLCAVHGVPAQLALEAGMACGFGACFGCVVETRHGYVRLCLDGPVLDGADLGPAAFAGAGHGS